MDNLIRIKQALISVSSKEGIIELARFLSEYNINIISTGGTADLLRKHGIIVRDVSCFTGFPEIMGGRVKTLNPKIHGALLGIPDNEEHIKHANDNDISYIELVITNLYPFVSVVKDGADHKKVIENIDIGGPAMIRSTAKNHKYNTIVTSHQYYDSLKKEISKNNGCTTLDYRKVMAKKAFVTTANYDLAVADYLIKDQKIDYPKKIIIPASLKQILSYGENNHQKAAIYSNDFSQNGIVNSKQIQGKQLSYNNLNDADAAFSTALEFSKDEAVCIIVKHTNPCGAAIADNINIAYKKALKSDSKSAFGGIVALNQEVDRDLALEMVQIFYEVIIAPSFTNEALAILAGKKNLRLLEAGFKRSEEKQIKSISGGILVQDFNDKLITKQDLVQVSGDNSSHMDDLLFAISICKHVKSNSIVVARNLQTIGIGAGQMNRVDAVEIACKNARDFLSNNNHDNDGLVLASDAFFPFADNIEIASKYNISSIISPKGSIKDNEVIEKAKELKINVFFIESRHFKH